MTAQTILPANSAASGGFSVDNSCRFNDDDAAYLHKTPSGAGNRQKFTLSCWLKKSSGGTEEILVAGAAAASYTRIGFEAGDELKIFGVASSSTAWEIQTVAKFRDFSAWYNFVFAFDTTQGTASNRIKVYVNGVRVTPSSGFGDETYPDQNYSTNINHTEKHRVGVQVNDSGGAYDGYMSEVVLIDNAQLDATSFGEFDEDSGIWKPIDVSDLTFGTNGFYLDFEASGNLGNDANGGTDLTEVNIAAVDQTTDTCTNNFATLNPLFPEANVAYTQGNTVATADGSTNWSSTIPTVGLVSGKWYWEWTATSTNNVFVGIVSETLVNSGALISDDTPYDQNGLILYFAGRRKTVDGTNTESHFTTFGSGTMSAALDLDSGTRTIIMYHNGSQTGDTIDLTSNFAAGEPVFPVFMVNAGSNPSIINVNFGNPSYANSSSAADGDGFGNFEFAPPSGYFAICTKNLAEYG